MNELEILKRKVEEMERFVKNLQTGHSLPLAFDQALTGRGFSKTAIIVSSKAADSENRSVNEGGVATYDVLKAPEGFLRLHLEQETWDIPAFKV